MWLIAGSIIAASCLVYVGGKVAPSKQSIVSFCIRNMPLKAEIMSTLVGGSGSASSSEPSTTEYKGSTIHIRYTKFGREHSVWVPYSRADVPAMSTCKVYAEYEDESRILLNQQSGVRYVVNAHMLGAKRLVIVDLQGRETTLSEHEIPSFNT